MSNNLYMPFHPGDYLTDTAHLSTIEHGAYLLLIFNYWQRGEPLPADDRKLRGIARMTAQEWSDVRATMMEFFQERDGALHHKRIDEELDRARARSTSARESAGKRRPKDKRTVDIHLANDERTLIERSANQAQEQDQDQKEDAAASSLAAAAAKLGLEEIERRCEEATGWPSLPAGRVIEVLISKGYDFEARILPLMREAAASRRRMGQGPPESWAYFTPIIQDATRKPPPSAKPIEMSFVPLDSPAWTALKAKKSESFLRSMLKTVDGVDGVWFPKAVVADRVAA